MKYLKKFETETAYNTFKASQDYITPNVSLTIDDNVIHYNPYVHDYSQDYFTMVVTSGGDVTWTGTTPADSTSNALSYSTDDGATWSTASSSITLSVNEGDKVLWKGTTTPGTSYPNRGIGNFSGGADVRYTVEGNAMSLLFGDDFKEQTSLGGKKFTFNSLFKGNINITSAENLSLLATILTDGCYGAMFKGCTSLTTAPELPATTLVSACYNTMFQDCTSLTTAPSILPAATLVDNCYANMFQGCTSLTTAPELLATRLGYNSNNRMFYGCTSLSSIKCLATNISASFCTDNWVTNVAASGTFIKAASMSSWTTGNNGIPSGWTVQDAD